MLRRFKNWIRTRSGSCEACRDFSEAEERWLRAFQREALWLSMTSRKWIRDDGVEVKFV